MNAREKRCLEHWAKRASELTACVRELAGYLEELNEGKLDAKSVHVSRINADRARVSLRTAESALCAATLQIKLALA